MHKKSAHFERFMINDDKSFYHWYANLLAYAESGEDGVEDVVGGDVAGDFAEVVEDAAEVLADKVSGEVVGECLLGIAKCVIGAIEGRKVAHI